MKKRILSVLLAAVMMIGLVPAGVFGASVVASGNCGKNGDNVTWTLDSEGTLTISGTGEMADYDFEFEVPWSLKRSTVKEVVIKNGVETIGCYAFEACTNLASVTIPGSVTVIEVGAFSYCSKLTSIKIPDSVELIGDSAFDSCSGLKSIEIPRSITYVGNWAFANCSSLTNINVNSGNKEYSSDNGVLFDKNKTELIKFPEGKVDKNYSILDSVIDISNWAFSGCASLTSVEIPSSVTSIGSEAFYECNNLKDVYYAGSEADWAKIIGTWNVPSNATIHYNSSGAESGVVVPSGKYCIQVVDGNGKPIQGARVEWKAQSTYTETTGSDGTAYFPLFTIGEPTITVSRAGYETWTNSNSNWGKANDNHNKAHYSKVILYTSGQGQYKLATALYSAKSDMSKATDILTKTKKLNLKNDGNWIGDLTNGEFYVSCSAVNSSNVARYELWQKDTKKIAETNTGNFGKLSVKSFEKGGGCFIRVVSKDGKNTDTNINLQFDENTVNKVTELDLSSGGVSFSVGDDVPYVGGSKLNFDFPVKVPVTASATEDKLQLGFNLQLAGKSQEERIEDFKDMMSVVKKNKPISDKQMKEFKTFVKGAGKAKFWKSGELNFAGYAEADFGSNVYKGQMMLTYKVDAFNHEYNTIVVVIPVTVQIKLGLNAQLIGEISYDFENATLLGGLDFEPSAKLTAFGGVGLSKIVGIGAYGSAYLKAAISLWGTQRGVKSVDLTGELGLRAYCLLWDYEKAFAHQTWHLYTANNVKGAQTMSEGDALWYEALYNADEYKVSDLSYLAEESSWLGGYEGGGMHIMEESDEAAKTIFTPLLENTYRNAQPVLVSNGNSAYAVFVRADLNSGKRYLEVAEYDGARWSRTFKIADNSELDDGPTMCVDENGKIWLAYSRATGTYNTLIDSAKNRELVVGQLDDFTLEFTEEAVFSGNGYVHMQKLETIDGKPVLTWLDSGVTDDNSVLRPESGEIMCSVYDGSSWSAKTSIQNVNGFVSNLVPGKNGGQTAIGYVLDGTLYCATMEGTNTKVADEVLGKVSYGIMPGTSSELFIWNSEHSLNSSDGNSVFAEDISHEYEIVGNSIYYSMASDNSANLAVLKYDDGQWGDPIKLTSEEKYLENLNALTLKGNDYVFGMLTDVSIAENTVDDSKNLVWSKITPVNDLCLDHIEYDHSLAKAGEEVPVVLTVTNKGDHVVNEIQIILDDNAAKTVNTQLLPGESVDLEINVLCSDRLVMHNLYVAEPGSKDYTQENNYLELGMGYVDMSVELDFEQIGSQKSVMAVLANNGVDTANGKVVFYDEEGNSLHESDFEGLNSGESMVISYVLPDGFVGGKGRDIYAVAVSDQAEWNMINNTENIHIDISGGQKEFIPGDINNSGNVDGVDKAILNRYLAGWEGYKEKILNWDAADIDGSGKVDGKDKAILNRYLAGWEGYDKYFKN